MKLKFSKESNPKKVEFTNLSFTSAEVNSCKRDENKNSDHFEYLWF